MSGFEVAGVVLGSIPLIVSALEHYKQGMSTIKTWRNYDRELRSLIRNLETEKIRFQDICEKLLIGLVPSSQIEHMVDDPFGRLWRQDSVQDAIKARLWRSYELFHSIVKDMEAAIKDIMRRLDLQPDGKIKWTEASFMVREFRRASFAIKRSDHKDSINTIKDSISSLESLIDRNIKMEPGRTLRSQGRMARLVHEVSSSVYRALLSGFSCTCAHKVHLGLTSRLIKATRTFDDSVMQKITFQLALTYDTQRGMDDNQEARQKTLWEEIFIRTIPPEMLYSLISRPKPPENSRPSITKQNIASSAAFRSSSTTATCVEETVIPVKTLQSELSSLGGNYGGVDFHKNINVCEKIRRAQKQTAVHCYGTISDETPQTSYTFGIYPQQSMDSRDNLSTVTLREVLEKPLMFPYMSVPVKLHLAAIISSSFLQLHQTPWLPDTLTSRDILFLKRGSDMELDYEHTFVMKKLPAEVPKTLPCGSFPSSRNPALLSLGILLLELRLGSTIESFHNQHELPPSGASSLMHESITAHRLLQQKQLGSLRYTSAVQRCLWGEFGRENLDLSSEAFTQEVYEKVVALLETDLRDATGSFGIAVG